MPLTNDSEVDKEDRLMMPHYKTGKTDCPSASNAVITEIVLDFENKLELRYHYNVKAKDL